MNSLEEKVPNKETKLKSLLRSRKRHEKVEKKEDCGGETLATADRL
ncbi:hypothetical protein AZE42_12768 [Rhizopogon vesiculosus]|uniref:Uncharacterized protein n=1 Tax=Rhizopogon vesiculosus TaxID=180088 RepID=A0A1J8QDJ2_9AGAM|nr:hypothetical protein AZE42_12768 [Rhizopogon vesiculosus]